ncbi:MAG: response regulator transcription factor [Anaerolineaceae bacterium]|nr:response regulator transcription factor [Anaerolineaceae bacterium]MCB9102517.1 response regulator transcription factor [Anaerolineales bacterium]
MSFPEKYKILVIDDDPALCQLISFTFSSQGFQVYSAATGSEGLRMFYEQRPDLIILDIMMPEMDGWTVCTQIRQLSNVPIIVLTSLGSEQDIVRGLECGAVDYVVKPFSPRVLVARARANLRQVFQAAIPPKTTIFSDGYLTIDLVKRRVLVKNEPVKLSATEYRLLAYLVQNANQVLTTEQILENVWGLEYRESSDYVHVYISHLRRKIEADPKQPRYILTEYGIGYYFEK